MSECLPLHDATSTRDERDGAGVLPLIDRALNVAGHALQARRGETLRLRICRRQGLGPIDSRCVAGEKDDEENARAANQGTRSQGIGEPLKGLSAPDSGLGLAELEYIPA